MCGIAGILSRDPRPREWFEEQLGKMNEAQQFRGPSGSGFWCDDRVGLGHVRLTLVGDRTRGHQPLSDESGAQLVFNGEIYEPDHVLHQMGLHLNPGESDATAMHNLLARQGPDGLDSVCGQFAACRYEPDKGRLTLVRDAFGQKPLYILRRTGLVYFASTVAALRAAVGKLEIRPEALTEYLVYRSVGGYRSAFQGVDQLPPGSWVVFDAEGNQRVGRWFCPPEPTRSRVCPDEVREQLDHAIRERLSSRFEQAIFLSGGLDSSLVAEGASRLDREGTIRFYSVGYDTPGKEDERPLARRMAESLPWPHEEITLGAKDIPALFDEVAFFTEDPIQDPVTLPTLLLTRAAAEQTRLVLTGDGSDEFWGGYDRFDRAPRTLEEYWPRTAIFTPQEVGLSEPPASYREGIELPPAQWAPLDRILRWEVSNRLRNYHLARIDKLSLAVGVEIRCPFLDRSVTRLAMSLPATLKRPEERTKGLLIDAYRDVLPAWLLQRKKQPFSMPIATWLGGPLRDFVRDTLSTDCLSRSLVQVDPLLQQLDEGRDLHRVGHKMWSLLQLESWYRIWK